MPDRYNLHEKLGSGAFGTVYRATDNNTGKIVAIKLLHPVLMGDPTAVGRFLREARLAATLEHPNIVEVFDAGQLPDGQLFIAMRFVQGESLSAKLKRDGGQTLAQALPWLEQVSSALDLAHRNGVVHCDLKPGNILLRASDGAALVSDFGLARALDGGTSMSVSTTSLQGTAEYIAPEIWEGKPATSASDVYALGCVIFEVLTGQPLFGARGVLAIARRHADGAKLDAIADEGVRAIVARAVSADPASRPAAVELAEGLRRVSVSLPYQPELAPIPKDEPEDARGAQAEALERARREAEETAKAKNAEANALARRLQHEREITEASARSAAVERQRLAERESARLATEKAERERRDQAIRAAALLAQPEEVASHPARADNDARVTGSAPAAIPPNSMLTPPKPASVGRRSWILVPALLAIVGLCAIASGVIPFRAVAPPTAIAPRATDVPRVNPTEVPRPAAFPPTATAVPPTKMAPTATPKPVEVTLWHAYTVGSAEEYAIAELLVAAAASPDLAGIKIYFRQLGFNDIFNNYRNDVAAGGGPSMFIAPNDSLGDDARGKLIADITDLAAGKLDGYTKLSVDGMSLNGRLYGIPETAKAVAMYYNKSLVPDPPRTTDEFLKAVQGGAKLSLSLGCYHHWGFYSGYGARVFDDTAAFVNTPENQANLVAAYKFLNDWWALAKKAGIPKTDGDAAAPFKEGKIGATTNGNWALGDYQKALGDKLGIAALPAGPKGPATPQLSIDGFFFNPNNKADTAQAALKVALFLTNAASQKVMAEKAGHVPVRTGVTYNNPGVKAFEDVIAVSMIRPQATTMGKYWGNFCGDGDIFDKGVDPTVFVSKAFAGATK